jgi:hypothetical protein
MIPVVVTENLILRGPDARDFDGYAAFWAGPSAKPIVGRFSHRDVSAKESGPVHVYRHQGRPS